MNLYRGIVINKECTVGKDAVYEILKGTTGDVYGFILELNYTHSSIA
jgi:cobalamin synthase